MEEELCSVFRTFFFFVPKVLTSAPADLGGKKPTLYRHPTAEHDPIQNSARRKPIGSTATLAVLKFRGSWQRGP